MPDPIVNNATGEVSVELGGVTYRLRASMNRVGELEAALGVDGFGGVQQHLQRASARVTLKAWKALCTSDNAELLADANFTDQAAAIAAIWKALTVGLPDAPEGKAAAATGKNGRHRGRDTAPSLMAS